VSELSDACCAPRSVTGDLRLACGLIEPSADTLLAFEVLLVSERPFPGFFPLRRFQTRAATYTGLTTPGFAAPPGFLNLLTLFSARAPSALFHAESVLGVVAFRGFPLPGAATAFTARCPSCPQPRVATRLWDQGFMHLGDPFTTGRCYPGSVGRSSPSLPPLRGILPSSLGFAFRQSLLSWAFPQRWTNPSLWRLSRVSKNPRIGFPLASVAILPEVFYPVCSR
jgi:hypothetical protein